MTTTISQLGVWGERWQTQENIAASPHVSTPARSDKDIRESYNAMVNDAYQEFIKTAAEFHDNGQCFGEDVARNAFATRDAIKKAHQTETSWLGQAAILLRNVFLYRSSNVSYEGLSRKKTPEEIAYSAFKTDGRDLGLNGNGLGDILDTWKAIKDVSTIYPEAITQEMVAAFKSQPVDNVNPAVILAAAHREASTTLVSEPLSVSDVLSQLGGTRPLRERI